MKNIKYVCLVRMVWRNVSSRGGAQKTNSKDYVRRERENDKKEGKEKKGEKGENTHINKNYNNSKKNKWGTVEKNYKGVKIKHSYIEITDGVIMIIPKEMLKTYKRIEEEKENNRETQNSKSSNKNTNKRKLKLKQKEKKRNIKSEDDDESYRGSENFEYYLFTVWIDCFLS